jgi:soluble lytic murein transglycosylase-like protein
MTTCSFYMASALSTTALTIAKRHALDPSLVCALIEQESAWNTHAIRYEPGFFAKYVAPLFTNNKVEPPTNTEANSRAISWGLMQVMGQSAREIGFIGQFLSELCDPAIGIEVGCLLFARKLGAAHGDIDDALQCWNGGANPNYAAEVRSRMPNYDFLAK